MGKIKTGIHPDMADPDHDGYGAEVIVATTDGRELRRRVDTDVLRGPGYPMSEAELMDKFTDCVSRVLAEGRIGALHGMLMGLDELERAADLSAFIEADRVASHAAE
jgi:hypothetical protein